MDFFLMFIISYFGLFIGTIISQMSKEELSPGKKYFRILKSIIFSLILGLFLFYLGLSWVSFLIAIIFFVISYITELKIRQSIDFFYYTAFAVILYEIKETTFSAMVATGIFFFGICIASLYSEKMMNENLMKRLFKISSTGLIFIVIGLVFRILKP